jgi:hypothetical protein
MLDGSGYARLIKDEVLNATTFTDRPIGLDRIGNLYFDQISYDKVILNKVENSHLGNYNNYTQNTNWVKEITQNALTNQADFSVRGGGDKAKYNMSVGYFDEGGTTKGNRLKKLNLRTSLDYDLSTKLQFRSDIMFTRYDQDATFDVEDDDFNKGGKNLVRSIAYRKMPNMSILDRDTLDNTHGKYLTPIENLQGGGMYSLDDEYFTYNPVAFVEYGVNKKIKDNTRALFSIKYTIVPSLILNSTVTLDIFDEKREKFLPYEAG